MENIKTFPAEAVAGLTERNQKNPPWRILVVEEDTAERRRQVQALRRQGYEVGTAADSRDGWLELQNHRYHLLMADNNLPGLSGLGLFKKLRLASMPLPVILAIEKMPPWQSPDHPWFLRAHKIFKPYTIAAGLNLVKTVLHTANAAALKARCGPFEPAW